MKLQRISEKLNLIFMLVKILSGYLLVSNTVKNTICIMRVHQPLTHSEVYGLVREKIK